MKLTYIEIETIAGEMCDNYCKYPHIYDEDTEEQPLGDTDICENCPMTRLLKGALTDDNTTG